VGVGFESLSYLAVYLPVELAALHAEAAGTRGGNPPEFGSLVLRDPTVRRAYRALDRAIGYADDLHHGRASGGANANSDLDDAAAQEAVCVAMTELIRRHAERRPHREAPDPSRGIEREPRIVRVVRDVIEDCYAKADETSLQVLAQRTGVTPFRVIRAFRKATGLAPHQYLIQVRVERARQFLADGAVPSLAALMTGFVDQSHLTYHFKKHLGITPGKYRRCVAMR
jgi:AraC-like DNA-binding protein